MKQHDVDVSPPANIMNFKPNLTLVTFDLDPGYPFLSKHDLQNSQMRHEITFFDLVTLNFDL